MNIVLNDHARSQNFATALSTLIEGADTLSIAVSYLQIGGWDLLRRSARRVNFERMRMVCTDQFGITQPEAVARALRRGVQIRNFTGNVVYHPKVYLAYDGHGRPIRFLVSSANLSSAAFSTSVEAGVFGDDQAGLRTLGAWFNDLFQNRSAQFTPQRLHDMEEHWRASATRRAVTRLQVRRGLVIPPRVAPPPMEAEDLDTLEDVFATVQVPIGVLNMDYAGNNIRNVRHVREILANWSTGRAVTGKQRSELKLLGFAEGPNLTPLGRAATAAGSEEEVARLWCAWIQRTDDAVLRQINTRLLVAKRVFPQFWRLHREVRDYFLDQAQEPTDRRTVQAVELLCNGSDVVQGFSLDDIRTLSLLLEQPRRMPAFIRAAIADYRDNKGMRGWNLPDRRIVPLAWRDAAGER